MTATTSEQSSKPTTTTNTWTIDPAHTSVTFSVRHMMVTNVRGEFQKVSGEVSYDSAKPEATRIKATIDAASINTREPQRDGHLKSPDFLDVATYPTLEFVSTGVRVKGKDDIEIVGELTIHGTTRPVTLALEGPFAGGKDPYGKQRLGATARTTIKRSDFGMKWNAAVEAGGVLVADEVKIELDVSMIR